VLYELVYGASRSQASPALKARLEALLRSLPILPFGEAEARTAARIRADLETAGKPIGPHDVLIAATALAHGATLVTRSVREFRRVKGLRVEDWY
jgi:tRNA(fMet)-specific endonuclease VapC